MKTKVSSAAPVDSLKLNITDTITTVPPVMLAETFVGQCPQAGEYILTYCGI
jgi:hypothetical protein